MNYLPEVLKILEGALRSNAEQAVNYARLLVEKLEQEGEHQQARLIQRKLDTLPSALVPLSGGQFGTVPIDHESRLGLAHEEHVPVDEPHVLLDEHLRDEVQRFLADVLHMDRLFAAGIQAWPRMLIFGPPGVGKTQLARFIAAQLGLPLLTARCDSLISSFLGSTAKNIRYLFDHASQRPCVLFLDEFDALAKARDDAQELGELKRVVVGLLQNMDALPPQTIVVAATNHEQLLDPAVWRRFNYRLQIHLPPPALRFALLQSYLGRFAASDLSLVRAVELTAGLSGGLIRQAVEDCIRQAVLANEPAVSEGTLLTRIAHSVLSAQKREPTREEITKLLLEKSVPLRVIAAGTGASMRQLLKQGKNRTSHKKQKGKANGQTGESGSRR